NVLCRRRDPWCITWLDREWRLRMHTATRVAPAVRYLEAEWGGARVIVGLSAAVIDAISAAALPGEDVLQWPQEVAMGAIEFSAELLSLAIEAATRKSLQCAGWSTQRPPGAGWERYGWTAESEASVLDGEFWLDPVACR